MIKKERADQQEKIVEQATAIRNLQLHGKSEFSKSHILLLQSLTSKSNLLEPLISTPPWATTSTRGRQGPTRNRPRPKLTRATKSRH